MTGTGISNTALRWVSEDLDPEWTCHESGTYAYGTCAADGDRFIPSPVLEQYTVWRHLRSEATRIRSVRDALNTQHGIELRVEALLNRDASFFTFQVVDADESPLSTVEYAVDTHQLSWRRNGADGPWATEALDVDSDGAILLPLMRNFLGPIICEIAGRPEGRAVVVVPELTDPNAASVFTPIVEPRLATLLSNRSESICLAEHTWECLAYRFLGGPYNDGSTFWICRRSQRLVRYIFEMKTGERWSAELVRLDSSLS